MPRRRAALWAAVAGSLVLAPGVAVVLRAEFDVTDVAHGQALYAEHCAACHGANLEGQANWRQRGPDGLLPAPPHDADGHTWHHPDGQLFQITKFGTEAVVGGGYRSAMRGFADTLSDGEITAILEFIKSRWPDNIRRRQAEISAASQ